MFVKRRYNRKKGTRKPFRRKLLNRRRILRPAKEDAKSEQVTQTPTFDASGSSIYLWQCVQPTRDTKSTEPEKKLTSLRQLCAVQVAQNCEGLSVEYLKEAPWSCWQHVWENILRLGKDSPDVFRMFAVHFGDRSSFRCHFSNFISQLSAGLGTRDKALDTALIPGWKKHRMDNVFSNVSLGDLATFIGKLHCCVVATCSNLHAFSSPQLISVASMANLVALDLSRNDVVDDQFVYTLRLCIASRNLNLRILKLSGCSNLTRRGLETLFEQDLSLCYVESDLNMITDSSFAEKIQDPDNLHTPVPGTKWKLLSESDQTTSQVAQYSLAYKVHHFLRNSELFEMPNLIWDLQFFPQAVDISNAQSCSHLHTESWSKRLRAARMKSVMVPYCYLKDPNQKIVPKRKAKPVLENLGPFTRQGSIATPRKVLRRPKITAADAKLYFGL